ncbi:hypothetical protein IWQ60_010651 [Tieghemiomyces parasiticus]|uniref:RRM domain-containing protein n=1 Tax=Tieghemiomyces parasiticus TaxID=78921 RepID=A0A9W8DI62_9FUNG|nr:hypothetical protein IWQ60_010651 [Tieghemiomyces parasiticus]
MGTAARLTMSARPTRTTTDPPLRPALRCNSVAPTAALIVSNLHWASSENDIRNRMGGTDVEAAVKHVVFHELYNSGKSQGSAYIIFEDQASATAAKESLEQVGGGTHQNHMPRNNMPYQKFGNPGYNMMGMNPMMGMPYGGMMPNPGMMGPMGCK